MKVLITLVLIIATGALAQDFGNCKACEYGLKVFFGHLRSQHGVNFQIAELSREVCPHQPHPFFCDWEVGRNWAGINHLVYDDSIAPYICTHFTGQNCTHFEQSQREWTCDNCMRDVVLISTQYSLPEITHGLEYWLMHEAYCEDPALGLNENQIEHCQDGIKGFLGPAFRALDAAYVAQAQSICHYWYDGVCPRPHY